MASKDKPSDPSGWQYRMSDIMDLVDDWWKHSRQAEATFADVLWQLPQDVFDFVKKRVLVIWKQRQQVAVLVPGEALKGRHLIILDTKIESQSRKIRLAILGLNIAGAFLSDHPGTAPSREELARSWGIDLAVLGGDEIFGLKY